MTGKTELAEERTQLAEDRTDWAADRTMLANMRTYAGWIRTGLAAFGIGLGIRAIYGEFEPLWLARSLASLFVVAGIIMIFQAYRNARVCQEELQASSVKPMPPSRIRIFSGVLILAGVLLIVVLWML